MIYFLIVCLLLTIYFSPYFYLNLPWLVLIIIYFINRENVIIRQERKIFNKLEIALNKPTIV